MLALDHAREYLLPRIPEPRGARFSLLAAVRTDKALLPELAERPLLARCCMICWVVGFVLVLMNSRTNSVALTENVPRRFRLRAPRGLAAGAPLAPARMAVSCGPPRAATTPASVLSI